MVDEPVKQFNIYLPVDLIRALKHHAVDTEQSLSAITTSALEHHLREYLKRNNPKRKAKR